MLDALFLLALAALLFSGLWFPLRRATAPRRPGWLAACALLGVALCASAVSGWRMSRARAAVVGPTLLRVATDRPMVALTFDDGPTPAHTAGLIDTLADYRVEATFYLTGRELAAHPELGRALVEAGHELGNHSWSHDRMLLRSQAWFRQQIDDTDARIRAAGHQGPISFRPPYGKRLVGLHYALGDRAAVLWDVEPESLPGVAHDADALAAHVVERAQPGSIILLHAMYDSRQPTRDALPALIEGLRARGLEPVSLRRLLEE